MAQVYIGIGSNIGDRHAHIQWACEEMAKLPHTELVATSRVYQTDPVGPVAQEKFLNAVAQLSTELTPYDLLDQLALIEQQAGREPLHKRIKWGPRTIDLDILLYDDRVISSDELVVPHPMMHERWFVLKPLAELNPGVIHPLLEMTIGDLLTYVEHEPVKPKTDG